MQAGTIAFKGNGKKHVDVNGPKFALGRANEGLCKWKMYQIEQKIHAYAKNL